MKAMYYILGALVLIGAMVVPQTTEGFFYWTAFMASVIYGLYMLRGNEGEEVSER